jgi:hypothetical protein
MLFEWAHPDLTFRTFREWTQIPTGNEFRRRLFCPLTDTVITISTFPYEVPVEKMESTATSMLQSKKDSYLESIKAAFPNEPNPDVSYDVESVTPVAEGTVYQIFYEGVHKRKGFFAFLGFVTPHKITNIFVETKISYAPGHRGLCREVLDGIEINLQAPASNSS